MYNINDVFYYQFINDVGKKFRLYFIKGDIHQIVGWGNVTSIVKFPDELIEMDGLEVSGGMPNDLPHGLQMANTIKFTLNLSCLTGDFELVKSWIIQDGSGEIDNEFLHIQGKYVSVPNRWILTEYNTTTSTDKRIIIDSFQEFKGTNKIKYSAETGKTSFDIECLGIEKLIYTSCSMDITNNTSLQSAHYLNNGIVYKNYVAPFGPGYGIHLSTFLNENNDKHYYMDLEHLVQIYLWGDTDSYYLGRQLYFVSYTPTDEEMLKQLHLTFYASGHTKDVPKTDEITPLIISSIENTVGNIIGGAFSTKSDASITKTAPTAWDFLQMFADSYYCKFLIKYESHPLYGQPVFTYCKLNEQKLFVESPNYKADKTLTLDDIYKNDFDYEFGFNKILQATRNMTDTGENNITKVEKTLNASTNDYSDDGEVLFHTATLLTPQGTGFFEYAGYNVLLNKAQRAYIRNVYFITSDEASGGLYPALTETSGDILKVVHESVLIDLGDSETFNLDTERSYQDFPYPVFEEGKTPLVQIIDYVNNCNEIAKQRTIEYSLATTVINLVLSIYSKSKQAVVELTLSSDKADITNVGEIYTIDLSDLVGFELNTRAYLVNVIYDVKKNQSKCKFFIRG